MPRTTRTTPHGRRAACLAALALALLPAAADARLGDPDPSFGGNGVAQIAVGPVGAAGAELEAITIRPDGRPVGAGWAGNALGLDEPLVVQFGDTGAVDATFGASGPGYTRIATTVTDTRLHGVAVDAAGRVLAAAGRADASTAPPEPVVLRFSATGAPDTTFSGVIDPGRGEARALLPLGDGTTLVTGWRGAIGQESAFVAKLSTTGALDPTFGVGGVADLTGPGARAEALAVAPTGQILAGGTLAFNTGGGTIEQAFVARLSSGGTLDPTFGTGGVLSVTPATNPDGAGVAAVEALRADAAGRFVVAGRSGRHAFVARRLSDGSSDPAFGTGNGVLFGTLPEVASLSALVLDGDRPYVAGRASTDGIPNQLLLGSLDANGAPVASQTFPNGFRTLASLAVGGWEALDAALAPGGALYTAGSLQAPSGARFPFIARHLPNAAPVAILAAEAGAAVGVPALFDAGGSSDPEGEALRYAFDLDGDGTFELDGGTNPVAAHSFPSAGVRTVGVRVSDPRGASAAATRSVSVVVPDRAAPRPVLSKQGVARPIRGKIRIRLPGKKRFVPLKGLTAIPNGTEIDARKGRVLLTVLHDASGRLDTARFYAGRFIFKQGKGRTPITTLRLTGGSFAGCGAGAAGARARIATASAQKRKKKKVRSLWGDGRGRFRTRGRYGAATVRGTKWLTRDRCDGTLVRVVRGKVAVDDLVRPRRKVTLVTSGKQILIAAKGRG